MTPISAHFSLEEVCHSQTAAREGVDNSLPLELMPTVKRTALGMELLRRELNSNMIIVSSWYRCESLERIIARSGYRIWCLKHGHAADEASWAEYFATKAHPKGSAVDFTCPSQGSPEKVMRKLIASGLQYDQLILEFDSWVHVSFDGTRRQNLIIDNQGTRQFT